MLTEKAKRQDAALVEYKSHEMEFLKMQEEYEMLKSSIEKVEDKFQTEKKMNEELKEDFRNSKSEYDQLIIDHDKLLTTLSVCAQTIKSSLQVRINF